MSVPPGFSRLDPVRCAFCGNARRLTVEHVLPQHWRHEFPDVSSTGWRRYDQGDGITEKEIPGTRYERGVKHFCKPCNSGWMQEMDMAAKPIMLELAHGRSRSIQSSEIGPIAAFATKVSLLRAMLDGAGAQPAAELYAQFYETRQPLTDGAVQVAACSNPQESSSTYVTAYSRSDSKQGQTASVGALHVVTYSIGAFAFQVALCPDGGTEFDQQRRELALDLLRASREFTGGKFVQLHDEDVPLSLLTDDELRTAREPLALRGLLPLVGDPPLPNDRPRIS